MRLSKLVIAGTGAFCVICTGIAWKCAAQVLIVDGAYEAAAVLEPKVEHIADKRVLCKLRPSES